MQAKPRRNPLLSFARLSPSPAQRGTVAPCPRRSIIPASAASAAADQLLAEAAHLQAIEGNPLTAEEIAMFEMFEREGWSPERRRAHILRRIEDRGRVAAAE